MQPDYQGIFKDFAVVGQMCEKAHDHAMRTNIPRINRIYFWFPLEGKLFFDCRNILVTHIIDPNGIMLC